MNFSQTPSQYFGNIYKGVKSTLVGMSITLRYFFTKPVTVQYPEERMAIAPRYRGLHYLEQDLCIACRVCEKACPIDCIIIRFTRQPGNVNEWYEFTLDYNKCMFCELCCYPCPKDCIHMTKEFSLVKYNRSQLVFDLLSWNGMRDSDRKTMDEAAAEKERKAKEAAAKKAAGGAAATASATATKPAAPAKSADGKPPVAKPAIQKPAIQKPAPKQPPAQGEDGSSTKKDADA
jgi:NADH-quinone oxidoreductase chain I